MPYVLEFRADRADLRLPSQCPYCMRRKADATIESRYSKPMAILPSPVTVFSSRESTFRFPACTRCVQQVRCLGKIAPPLGMVPAALLLLAAMNQWSYLDLILYTAVGCAVLAGAMLVARQWKLMKFRVGYQGEDCALIYASSRTYAEEMAQLNHVPMRHRWLVFRWF